MPYIRSGATARWLRGSGMRRASYIARRRAIVRVAARRALVGRAYTGGAIAAGALVGYGAYRGIRRIRRARARRIKRRQIGKPVRRRAPKANQLASVTLTNRPTIDLYVARITDIDRTTTDEQDQRTGTEVNFLGWRMYMQLRNELSNPQLVNVAIISDKHFQQGETQTAVTSEFFRSYTNTRVLNFSNALTSTELHNFPINSDRWTVLHRWKFLLAAKHGEDHQVNANKSSFVEIKKWITLKRKLQFTDASSAIVDSGSCYLVIWSDVPLRAALTAQTVNALGVQFTFIQYFRDVH